MDLTLSEEHASLRATVEDFARKGVAPVIGEIYERGEFPYEIVEDGRDGPVRPADRRGLRRHGRGLLRPHLHSAPSPAFHRAGHQYADIM
jgi:hypothetical protein